MQPALLVAGDRSLHQTREIPARLALEKRASNAHIVVHPMATDMFYGASPIIFERAKQLRAQLTPAESYLWKALRANQLDGFRFKSQHPINTFIADFYCHSAKLVVELDGAVHDSDEQQAWDLNRTYIIEEFGIRVIRFNNDDVLKNREDVLNRIKLHLINPS